METTALAVTPCSVITEILEEADTSSSGFILRPEDEGSRFLRNQTIRRHSPQNSNTLHSRHSENLERGNVTNVQQFL
jgi:hypothetical protein